MLNLRCLFFVFSLIAPFCVPISAAGLINPSIPNAGFENGSEGWTWVLSSGCQAGFRFDTGNPHSGKQCVVFSSNTPLIPNVYGRLSVNAEVLPSTKYELSCWVRAKDASDTGGVSHLTDWSRYTLSLPGGTYGWRRVSTEFTTNAGQTTLNIGINIVNTCKELAIDDIALRPVGGQLQGAGISGVILNLDKVIGHNSPVPISVLLDCSNRKAATLEGSILSNDRVIKTMRSPLRRGETKVTWEWNTGNRPFGDYTLRVRVLDALGSELTSATTKFSSSDSPLFAQIQQVEERKKGFDALFRECQRRGVRLDYPAAAKETLEQFIPYAKADVRAGMDYRVKWALSDFDAIIDTAQAEMQAYLSDPELAPVARRYRTGAVDVQGLSFIGDRVTSTGENDRGPVFLVGYGHFTQLRTDMKRFPRYGTNIIQFSEFGPSAVFPEENKVSYDYIKILQRTLDEAAKNNVRVDFLISPHYFPAWAMQKYPQLGKGGGGFLGFCVDDPVAKDIIERYLRVVIPMIKDKPALGSFCLTNEPVFDNTVNCENTKQIWVDYLKRVHKDIATLNARYGTSYPSFDEVPYSGDPQAYDWLMCAMERFAGWHKWMGDIIHEMAPNIPVHAKVMSFAFNPNYNGFATDQELFGQLLDLNGNDCYEFPGSPDWPMDAWMMNTSYDLQRSFARKPIFNSENHIAPDGSNYYISPGNFRTALWQGAIHGQSATTIWVWERAFDNLYGFIGSVMDRPACAEAVGVTCLDLNRFAGRVTALQNATAPAAILYSRSSMVRHGQAHSAAMTRVYQALNFMGNKVDFISEKQLAAGKASDYKLIIIPEVETLTDAAFAALQKTDPSSLLLLGECFTRNEYGQKRDPAAVSALVSGAAKLKDGDPEKDLWPQLRQKLTEKNAVPGCAVVDAESGQPIWGVEWLATRYQGKELLNIVNLHGQPHRIKIVRNGQPVEAKNLLSLGGKEPVGDLKPLTPVLTERP
ncbi:MAG: beta-galactosidase [Armatimonadetes bacterium]|nr:beta-galactosidase [Armatimonadota bacterium]